MDQVFLQRLLTYDLPVLIDAAQRPGFYRALGQFLNQTIPFDSFHIMTFKRNRSPEVLELDVSYDHRIVDDYLCGYYLYDPVWRFLWGNQGQDRTYCLAGIAPDDFYKSNYFTEHYAKASVCDELGWTVWLSDTEAAVVCLLRQWRNRGFSAEHKEYSVVLLPVISSLIRLRFGIGDEGIPSGHRATEVRPEPQQLQRQCSNGVLTLRQSQIVDLLLDGCSTESIAMRLGISPETVKTHKKSIYMKLKISSQAELFKMALDAT